MQRFQNTVKALRRNYLMSWSKSEAPALIAIAIGNVLMASLAVQLTLASKGIVDGAVGRNEAAVHQAILQLLLYTLGILGLRVLLSHLSDSCRIRLNKNIRREMIHALFSKQYAALKEYHSGDLTNRLLSDVRIVVDGIIGILPALLNMATRLISASIVLFQINWRFTLLLYVAGLGLLVCAGLFRRRMQTLNRRVQEDESRAQASIQEAIANMRLVLASGSEDHIESQIEQRQAQHVQSQMKRKSISLKANAGLSLVMEGCWLYTLIWGCFQILNGSISYGTLTAMTQLVGQIQSPFTGLSSLLQRFYSMASSAERLEELLTLPEREPASTHYPAIQPDDFLAIEYQDVCFAYDRSGVLERVNGRIEKGDFVAITGLSGGGKSTLFFLMLGIYQLDGGAISCIGSHGLYPAGLHTRNLFAYVPQGNSLFSGTLRENLTMFRPQASDAEIMNAAQIACISNFICELPDGLDTRIGERGLGLSEGQAQRLAIARAFLSRAPILLLDEATSALDDQTEAQLLGNLHQMRNRTCLIVTHRDAALRICNKQLVLAKGCGEIRQIVTVVSHH